MKALAFQGSNRTIVDNSPLSYASDFGKTQKNLVKYGKSIHQRNAAAHLPQRGWLSKQKMPLVSLEGEVFAIDSPFYRTD